MTITPDQARELLDGATPGPWYEDGSNIMNHDGDPLLSDGSFGDPNWYNVRNLTLMTAAPDLAQTIAGMTEEWGVERDRPGTAYIDGTVARWITWIGDEARARKACVISPRGGNPRLARRLVGPVEVTE